MQVAATLEAVKHSPVNLNVAASLSIAGIGAEATQVIVVRMENLPSPDNPHTSYIAPLSALALLGRITDAVQIGT